MFRNDSTTLCTTVLESSTTFIYTQNSKFKILSSINSTTSEIQYTLRKRKRERLLRGLHWSGIGSDGRRNRRFRSRILRPVPPPSLAPSSFPSSFSGGFEQSDKSLQNNGSFQRCRFNKTTPFPSVELPLLASVPKKNPYIMKILEYRII